MDENLELLECIYQNADMGTKTLTDLLTELKEKDNKIKNIVGEELKVYESFVKESKDLLKKDNVKPKAQGFMADIMAKMGIKREVIIDNSDSAIAEMLIEGFTMGNLQLNKLINNYKDHVDKKVLKLANDLHDFGEREIAKLKAYL